MFLVVWTKKIRDEDYPEEDWSGEDHWMTYDTYKEAEDWFNELLAMDDVYTVTIAQPVKSTDYDCA
jgi:hypothetical protein